MSESAIDVEEEPVPKSVFEAIQDRMLALFKPRPEPRNWVKALVLAGLLTAAVAFGVTVWAANPDNRLAAVSGYTGCVGLVVSIGPWLFSRCVDAFDGYMDR